MILTLLKARQYGQNIRLISPMMVINSITTSLAARVSGSQGHRSRATGQGGTAPAHHVWAIDTGAREDYVCGVALSLNGPRCRGNSPSDSPLAHTHTGVNMGWWVVVVLG